MVRYTEVNIDSNNQFLISDVYIKPERKNCALHTLEKIETIINQNIENSAFTAQKVQLLQEASRIKNRYMAKTAKFCKLRKWIFGVTRKEEHLLEVYHRIVASVLPSEPTHQMVEELRIPNIPKLKLFTHKDQLSTAMTDYMGVTELARLMSVAKAPNLIAKQAMEKRAQRYGFLAERNPEGAQSFLKTLFYALPYLCGEKYVRHKGTTLGAYVQLQGRKVDRERTLIHLVQQRECDPEMGEKIRGIYESFIVWASYYYPRQDLFVRNELMKAIVYLGLDPNKNFILSGTSGFPVWPLGFHAHIEDVEGLELLLRYGAKPNEREPPPILGVASYPYYMYSILQQVISHYRMPASKKLLMVQKLLEYNADPNLVYINPGEVALDVANARRPLFEAVRQGYPQIAKLLLDHGALADLSDIDEVNGRNITAHSQLFNIHNRKKRREMELILSGQN